MPRILKSLVLQHLNDLSYWGFFCLFVFLNVEGKCFPMSEIYSKEEFDFLHRKNILTSWYVSTIKEVGVEILPANTAAAAQTTVMLLQSQLKKNIFSASI